MSPFTLIRDHLAKYQAIWVWILNGIALGLLWPGLTQPMLTIRASIQFLGQRQDIFFQQQSILQSIESLHQSQNDTVAGLILLFSVIVPLSKAVLSILSVSISRPVLQRRMKALVSLISKWAMADVFVVGIFIAYLAGNASGMIQAQLESGFGYFVSYCLVSILIFQVLYRLDISQGDQ